MYFCIDSFITNVFYIACIYSHQTALMTFSHAILISNIDGKYTMIDTIAHNPFGESAFTASCSTVDEMCDMLHAYCSVKVKSNGSSPWEAVVMTRQLLTRQVSQGKRFHHISTIIIFHNTIFICLIHLFF